MADEKELHIKELASNRKATFDYEIIETLETGLVLKGTEIKSLRQGGAHLTEAYITVDSGELWLVGSQIAPYGFASFYQHEEKRKRKLLAHKKEIERIQTLIDKKGFSCIPLKLYLKNGKAKLLIAIARGKKLFDKREAIKARDDKRSMQRALKETRRS